ncbi:50S ribosomal protein L25 [Chitinispirillales bacterium ANBcel5]|uniref:50S ribosomal protein L25 n=1 Tax=Cellulosispirillum alkaliphilum TaxID=3039283 RepID=UPI002A58ECA3|nr:50S ribosomal protein L25 [Chitinispirillales bacterium ANBcel5]
MDIIKLQARERTDSGKSYTRKARAQGWVPAIYYGHDQDPVKIEVSSKDFSAIARAKQLSHLIDLGLDKDGDSVAVIREIQRNVLKNDVYFHIDFLHVAMDKTVTVDVPVEVTGVPVGVKVDNGILGHPVRTVMVECMPRDIPEKISIDVSELKVGDSIHVRDVTVPNLKLKDPADEVLAVVTPPTREAEETSEEGGAE